MHTDFFSYAQDMKKYLDVQAQRIANLEAQVYELTEELKKIASKPPVNIENIEYKFDQLKIEKLDGTLNIGLNPASLHELEEFSVNNQEYPSPFPKHLRQDLTEQISGEITQYIEQNLSGIISDTGAEMGTDFREEYNEFIKNDLYKQLPDRVQYYLNQFPYNEHRDQNPAYKERIIEQIKTDIEQAVRAFLANIPGNMKGE